MTTKEPVKILFITQEIDPYLHESEIADLCRKFPQLIQERGCEIRIFMPCYGTINERRNQLHEVQRLSGMNIIIDDTDHPLVIKVASIQSARMQVYFIDSDDYFRRRGIITDKHGSKFDDNDERAIFYARSVLETIKKLRWTPDIIHCTGWISSIAPIYIKKSYNSDPFFANSKVVYSLMDSGFEGNITPGFDKRIHFENIENSDIQHFMQDNCDVNAMHKLAIDFSDHVIVGSENINGELLEYLADKSVATTPYCEADKQYETYYELFTQMCPRMLEEDN